MAESCPLELSTDANSTEGWIWEPTIPAQCYDCMNAVPDEQKVIVFNKAVDAEGDNYPEDQERYFVRGINRADEYSDDRMGIEERGIDQATGYDGPKEAEAIFNFRCLHE